MDVREKILHAVGIAVASADVANVEISLEHPAELKNGDYSTGVALQYAKQAGMKCVAVTFTTERPFLNKADLIIDGFKQLTTEKIKNL